MSAARGAAGLEPSQLGLALGWHSLPFEALLELVQRAERLGFRAVYVDGDVSQIPSRGDGDVLDGWTLTTALLARTERIEIGSIRLVHHWNAAKLAQAVATAERIAPGRLRLLVSVGGQPSDRRFGLSLPGAAERVAWLDETLTVCRALWRGEDVSFAGRFVRVDRARVRPVPEPGRPRIEVAGRGPRLLEVLARHGDAWDVNLPPLRDRMTRAENDLKRACELAGRDPASIPRSMWILTRPHGERGDPGLMEDFRRWCPWYADVPDAQVHDAIAAGPPASCRRWLSERALELGLSLVIADLSGLGSDAARRAVEALGAGEGAETFVDPST